MRGWRWLPSACCRCRWGKNDGAQCAIFFAPGSRKPEKDRKKTPLNRGFYENKKIYSAKMKRCAEFGVFL
ncbi:hypothetical protein EQG67_03020 [Kosakonia cowanii]|nr:hypothetical protein EQG67_03020 [Kosakonia cowanii]